MSLVLKRELLVGTKKHRRGTGRVGGGGGVIMSNRIFMFLINPPSGKVRIQKLIAKIIFDCFKKRKGEDGKVNIQGLLSP